VIGRWGRAEGLLRPSERRVLDAGCAFGFGTASLARRRWAVGLERSARYLAQAHARSPSLPLVRGDVTALPFADGSFDAVLLLDVLEHLPDPARALAEARRVLRPGGALVCTVPHLGPLAWLDSLNLYASLAGRLGWSLLDPTETGGPQHRHYSVAELAALLEGFRIEQVQRSGLGLGEPLHLALLILLRGLLRAEGLFRRARFAAFAVSVLDDALPAGPLGYNLCVRATKLVTP
jgi:SAM-dependent methyltransferase